MSAIRTGSSARARSFFSAIFVLLCADLLADCEDLTQRRRGSQRSAEGSSSLRFSALFALLCPNLIAGCED